MYAIVRDGGRQHRVAEGDVIQVDLRQVEAGGEIVFPDVLLYADEDGVRVGQPTVVGVQVKGVVEGEVKGPKLQVVHFRRRKDSRTRRGHRQHYLAVRITEIARTGAPVAQE